jgi:hypothetical protein
MKREILLTAAVFAVFSAFPQNAKIKQKASGEENVKHLAKIHFANEASVGRPVSPAKAIHPQPNPSSTQKTSLINGWSNFSTSANIYGVLISYCKPLHYNDELNAVSFIHRKPSSYLASPAPAAAAASGLMVAAVSGNWGSTWDSTLIWNNDINWGRYPGGGIYNPPGNASLSAAYVVGHGPTTSAAGGWAGNFFASKQLNTFNNIASAAPNAQQWMDVANPNPNVGQVDFAAYGFTSTDDGKVRALGGLLDANAGSDSSVVLVTGSFNSGVFDYVGTTLYVPATIASDGSKNFLSRPMMAWNEAGTVGYISVVGQKIGATGSNAGPQPMVWKTTNSGASWAMIPEINFNNAAFDGVKQSLPGTVNDSTQIAPWFSWIEGMDMAVDANNKLHFFSTVYGSPRTHVDSVFFLYQFPQGSETYRWPHQPGFRPYLYDFITDGTGGWSYKTVDSMSTEGPAGASTGQGFGSNPWDLNGADKPRLDARLQMSRTPNGKYIFYSWSESDTNFTSSAVKWNVLPNIKVRAYSVDQNEVLTQEYNITEPASAPANPNVASKAFFHFMAPRTSSSTVLVSTQTSTLVSVRLPFTITNSPGYNQLIDNSHWYNTAELQFGNAGVSVSEQKQLIAESSFLYPNPSSQTTNLSIQLAENEMVGITIYNLMGQVSKAFAADGQRGENTIAIDLNGIEKGIYLVKINVGNVSSTKKLIVE